MNEKVGISKSSENHNNEASSSLCSQHPDPQVRKIRHYIQDHFSMWHPHTAFGTVAFRCLSRSWGRLFWCTSTTRAALVKKRTWRAWSHGDREAEWRQAPPQNNYTTNIMCRFTLFQSSWDIWQMRSWGTSSRRILGIVGKWDLSSSNFTR